MKKLLRDVVRNTIEITNQSNERERSSKEDIKYNIISLYP